MSKTLIIAEAGVNHNGKLSLAKKLIEKASYSGANAIKFQTFKASGILLDKSLTYTYRSQGKEVKESMYEMFERCEFVDDEWKKIKQKCIEENILFLSTLNKIDKSIIYLFPNANLLIIFLS